MLPHRPQLLTGLEMFMRPAHFLSPVFLAAALVVAVSAGAQTPLSAPHTARPAPAAQTDHPAAVASAPVHLPLPASGELATPSTDWRRAHTAVGAFPRGHADIVAWEAAQARGAGAAAPDSAMPHAHHGMAAHESSPSHTSPSHSKEQP